MPSGFCMKLITDAIFLWGMTIALFVLPLHQRHQLLCHNYGAALFMELNGYNTFSVFRIKNNI